MSGAAPRLSDEAAALARDAETWLAHRGLALDTVVAQVERVIVGLAGGPPPGRDGRP